MDEFLSMDSTIVSRSQCPKCLDTNADNLVNYSDGHSYCYACALFTPGHFSYTPSTRQEWSLPMHTTASILSKRGISAEAIKSYGVHTSQTDDGQLWVKFPIHDVNGAVYTQHMRAVDTSTGTLTRDMKYPKGAKLRLPLFGWNLVKSQPTIVVTEGETDALILSTRLGEQSQVAVVGMLGTAQAEKTAAHLVTYAESKTVVLAFDSDKAGKDALDKLVSYCERHESPIKLLRLVIPAEYKDLGEWLSSDSTVDIKSEIAKAVPVAISGILGSEEIADSLESYIESLRANALVDLKFSPLLSESLRFLPGKLIGVAGSSGQGKSTLAEHFIMEHLDQQKNVFVVSQEMMPSEVALKLARMIRNQPLDSPRFLQTLSDEDIASVKATVRKLTKLMNATDGFGVMEVDLIDKHLHKLTSVGQKPDLVIIDHLLAICRSSEANSIMEVCRDLKELARNHQTCIVLLSHVRKSPPGKSKTIYRPQLDDLYGSSGLAMYADCILAVASDKAKQETYIETIKVERLGGQYTDVSFKYQDYILTELEEGARVSYESEETFEDVI